MRWPGSTRTLEELVENHYSSLFRYAYRLTGNSQEAEDLTQDAFCQAQVKWSQLRDRGEGPALVVHHSAECLSAQGSRPKNGLYLKH